MYLNLFYKPKVTGTYLLSSRHFRGRELVTPYLIP